MIILKYYLSGLDDPDEMQAMDAFDDLILIIIWLPWYIGVLISCAVRNIRSIRNKNKADVSSNE